MITVHLALPGLSRRPDFNDHNAKERQSWEGACVQGYARKDPWASDILLSTVTWRVGPLLGGAGYPAWVLQVGQGLNCCHEGNR